MYACMYMYVCMCMYVFINKCTDTVGSIVDPFVIVVFVFSFLFVVCE